MSERAKDRVSGACEHESGRVNKRVDEAVLNDRVLARGIRLKLGQQVTVSEQSNGQANERSNKQVYKQASRQASGPIPIKGCFAQPCVGVGVTGRNLKILKKRCF